MVYSLTGYGRVEKKYLNYTLTVEIRSLNGRYFDMISKIHDSLYRYEDEIYKLVKEKCQRGKVYLNINLDENREIDPSFKINKNKIKTYISQINQIKNTLNIKGDIKIEDLMKIPNLFENVNSVPRGNKKIIISSVKEVLDQLNRFREKEGKVIEKDIIKKIKIIYRDIKKIIRLSTINILKETKRIKDKIDMIMPNFNLNEDRLYQEVALILEKKDINEELSRLESHMDLLLACVSGSSKGNGKKINFLLQEINRETNTIGSKVDNIKIRHTVVEMKNSVEQIREQIQNIL